MGVGQVTGVDKKGIVAKTVRGIGLGVLVAALAACSTGGTPTSAPNVTLQQALSDYFAGNIQLAKAEFQTVVKNDPNEQYGWYNLGVIAQGASDSNTAEKDYKKAIAIQPNFQSALYNLGVLLFQKNKIPDAIDYLGKAAAANPKDANSHWNLGLALAETHKPADNARAKIELNRALKLNPDLIKTLGTPSKTTAPTSGGTAPAGGIGAKPNGQTATTKPATP